MRGTKDSWREWGLNKSKVHCMHLVNFQRLIQRGNIYTTWKCMSIKFLMKLLLLCSTTTHSVAELLHMTVKSMSNSIILFTLISWFATIGNHFHFSYLCRSTEAKRFVFYSASVICCHVQLEPWGWHTFHHVHDFRALVALWLQMAQCHLVLSCPSLCSLPKENSIRNYKVNTRCTHCFWLVSSP